MKMVFSCRLEQFRNWCRPKRQAFSWFSLKENHSSRSLSDHSNCETALKREPPCELEQPRRVLLRGDLPELTVASDLVRRRKLSAVEEVEGFYS